MQVSDKDEMIETVMDMNAVSSSDTDAVIAVLMSR